MKHLYYFILSAIITISHAQTVQWASEVIGFSSRYSDTKWSAQQVLGKPNTMPQGGQGECSWVPDNKEKEVWIKVGFEKPMQIRQVVVAENYHPGSIYGIIAWDSTENISKIVYDEKALRLEEKSRMLNAIFPLTDFKVAAIELLIDGKTWHGQIYIDAIGISTSKRPIKAAINLPEGLKDEFILNAFPGAEKISYKPEKLGKSINTTYPEDYPVISSDGKTLFFTRARLPKHSDGQANSPENMGGVLDSNDIYYSTVKNDGAWTNAVNIGAPLNNNSDNFACSISPDGNSLLLVRKYDESGNSIPGFLNLGFGLFIAKKTIDGWSAPQKQTIKKFKSNNINVEFELSDDGKYLLMSLDKGDGYGERDLYVSLAESENNWSAPVNLGSIVNTASDEISPFLAADGVSLYFSSKGFSGYGGYDIYKTIRLDDTWQNWSEPENQGPGINSNGNESCFTIPYSGDQAYFLKKRSPLKVSPFGGDLEGASSAIYRINLQDALKPYLVYSVSGIATNVLTKEPVEAEVKLVCLDNNQVYGVTKTNPEDGSYSFTWIFNKYCHNYSLLPTDATFFVGAMNFNISVKAEMKEITYDLPFLSLSGKAINVATRQPIATVVNLICLDRGEIIATTKTSPEDGSYSFSLLVSADCHKYSLLAADTALFPVSINFDTEQIAELKDESFDLKLLPIEVKQTIRLNSIFFELGKSALQDESLPELNRMVKFMKDRPSLQIEIAGHTDNIGSHKHNHTLSHDRSKAVSDFLIQNGIDKKRMHVKGYGENKPVTSNDTEKGRRLNRRVEFTILKK